MAISIPERSAEDRVAGILRIDVGGATKRLPTLPMNAAQGWIDDLGSQVASLANRLAADDGDAAAIMGLASFSVTAVLDAVVAYDRTSALGGREWLADNADPEQLYVAFRQIVKVVFPFVEELGGLMQLLPGLLQAASSPRPSSTNGSSPTGGSIPEPSAIASMPSSSSSSGRPGRNAAAASTASA